MGKKSMQMGDTNSLKEIQKKYKSIVPEFEYERSIKWVKEGESTKK